MLRISLKDQGLPFDDPLTSHFSDQFEQLGLFFAEGASRVLQRDDALILQYLNNVPIDYGLIQLESDLAKQST